MTTDFFPGCTLMTDSGAFDGSIDERPRPLMRVASVLDPILHRLITKTDRVRTYTMPANSDATWYQSDRVITVFSVDFV